MKKTVAITVFVAVGALIVSLYCFAAPKGLSADLVRDIFSTVKCCEGEGDFIAANPDSVTFAEGSFTRPGATEAVVAFVDDNQPHVALPGELWLIGYNKTWKPSFMIDESDKASFSTVDIAHDGTSEVLYTLNRWLTGGILLSRHALVSLKGGEIKTIYTADGTGYAFHVSYEQFGKDQPIVDHEIRLEDTNGDGTVELIDTELSGAFVHTGKGDDDGWEIQYTPTTSTTYRFIIDADKNILGVDKLSQ